MADEATIAPEETTQGDPFAKYGGKAVSATPAPAAEDPFSKFGGRAIPKKDLPSGGGSTSQPSWNGLNLSQSSPTNTPFSGVTNDPALQQQLVQQGQQQVKQEQDAFRTPTQYQGAKMDYSGFVNMPKQVQKPSMVHPTIVPTDSSSIKNPRLITNEEDKQAFGTGVKPQQEIGAPVETHADTWGNIGSFLPHTVLAGLQKDAGQALQFLGGKIGETRDNTAIKGNNDINKQLGLDPYGKEDYGVTGALTQLGLHLENAAGENQATAESHNLPNTTMGGVAKSAIGFIPDIIELAATPELDVAKLGKLSEVLTKYGGKYAPKVVGGLGGKFPVLMGTKGLTSGYTEGKEAGMSDYDATSNGLVKSAEEYGKGLLFEGAGAIANKASKVGIKALEDAGWMKGGKIVEGAQKAILHSTAQATAFGAVPFITNAVQGKDTSLEEFKQNAIFGGMMGLFHGGGKDASPNKATPADGSAAQVLARSPLIDLHNFMQSDMDVIKLAHDLEANPADLHIKAAIHANDAYYATSPEARQDNIVQSSLNAKLASVKSFTNAILEDKDAVIKGVEQVPGLEDSEKQAIIDKVNQVHKAFDPIEQQKTGLAKQITDLEEAPKGDIIGEKEKAVKLKDLNKQLDEIVTNQYDQQQDRASGKKVTYSKGAGEDEGKFFKTKDGEKEEITKSRYQLEKPTIDEQTEPNAELPAEAPANEPVKAPDPVKAADETPENNKLKSDADIENRMSELQNSMSFTPEREEYNKLEKEMERREKDSVFSIPLNKASDAIDALLKKNKEMPNGYGAFIEKRDALESKEVIERYTTERDRLTEKDIKADFKVALMGNPDTWYADGLKLRESANLAAERGIDINYLLENVKKDFTNDGFSDKEAKEVIARRLASLKPKTVDEAGGDNKVVAENATPAGRTKIPDSEAPDVKELGRNLKPEGKPGITIEPSFERAYEKPNDLTEKELENGQKYVVSRDKDGKVNGVLEVSYQSKNGVEKEPQAVKVAVDEGSRRQGIATALFKHAEEQGIDLKDVRGKATTDAGQALYEANMAGEKVKSEELSHADADRKSIEEETDPKQLASRYHSEENKADYKEQGIIDYLGNGKINEKDYRRWGDRSVIGDHTDPKLLRWIDSQNSDRTDLAKHAEILSDQLGVHVDPEDFIHVIDNYTGKADFDEKNKTDTQRLLEQRYEDLTGNKLTPKRAEKSFNEVHQTVKLTPTQRIDFNKAAKEIGLTEEDYDRHAAFIKATGGHPDFTGDAETAKDKVSKSADDKSGGKEIDKGRDSSQSSYAKPTATDRAKTLADKIRALKSDRSKLHGGLEGVATAVYDGALETVATVIEQGGKLIDAIQAGIDHIKANSDFKNDAEIKAALESDLSDIGIVEDAKGLPKEVKTFLDEPTDVKKTILTKRAYEGEIQDDVKKYLEDKGLTRKSFSQEERSDQATDFIKKFGEDAAIKAIEAGDIDGGMAASILAQLQIKNTREMADLPIGSEERDTLAKKQADTIALMEKKGYLGGEFNGQLAYEYQNAELDYANVKKQVEKLTGRTLTKEQEAKVKKITAENEKLKTKLKEAEAKLIDETDKALTGEDEPVKTKPKTEYAQKALDAVVKVRAKIRANSYSDATGMVALVDSGLATIEAAIRTGMTVTKAIEKGIAYIKSELGKKGIDAWEKEDDFRKDVTDAFADEGVSDTKNVRDENDLQQANIKRLEKELTNAKENRLKDAPTKREPSDEENDLKEQIKQEKLRISLEDMQTAFVDKTDNKFTPAEAKDIWGYMKGKYIENGVSYRDALSKTAQDLGLSWRQMSEAITTPKNKRASDEMWKQQADYIRNNNAIKNWIGDQNKSGVWKAWQRVSGLFRGVAVFGHGHIFVGTHAGMTLFNPRTLPLTLKAFLNGWKLAYGKEANYERAMEELKNSPNYLIAQRAGLKNNPERINNEEYQNSQKYLGRLGLVGERGFNAIKILRQDLFDHEFNRLSPAERDDPEVAKSIAHLMNLATGATTLKIPALVNEITFAGGMEAARWQKLLGSPAKAAEVAFNAIADPEKSTVADRVFAKVWARRVGQQLATFTGALLVNSAIQNSINPQNKVNITDPDAPDFLKFKFGETTIDPTSGMRSTFAFLYKLGKLGFDSDEKLKGEKRSVVAGKDVAKYTLGKLAPVYGAVSDFYNRRDFNNNVMPFSDEKPAKYAHKLTWGEYGTQKLPLPLAEAATVFYQSALEHGAHKQTMDDVLKGLMTGALSGSTGFRVGEYTGPKPDEADKKLGEIKVQSGTKYKLTEPQVAERKQIEADYLKENGEKLTEKFTKEAVRNEALRDKIKEDTALWKKQGVDADLQKQYVKEMTDKFVTDKLNEVVNNHSRLEILKKYRVSHGVYNLKKAE